MAFTLERTIRFDEVDFARVVYFPRYFEFCHQTFEDFFNRDAGVSYVDLVAQRGLGFPIVHAEADYSAPLRFGDRCHISLEFTKVGSRSLAHRYRLSREEGRVLAAEVRIVSACIAIADFKPTVIPDDLRQVLERHLALPER